MMEIYQVSKLTEKHHLELVTDASPDYSSLGFERKTDSILGIRRYDYDQESNRVH